MTEKIKSKVKYNYKTKNKKVIVPVVEEKLEAPKKEKVKVAKVSDSGSTSKVTKKK